MKLERYLHRALPVLSILAALGPGTQALKMFRARDLATTITQYGALPEISISSLDYITLGLAIILLIAAIMEVIRFRIAAPLAFLATMALWTYYIPGISDEISGTMWFAMKLGRTTGLTWQMLVYQTTAMVCAGVLTYMRFRPLVSRLSPRRI